jgi:hypothetical protein
MYASGVTLFDRTAHPHRNFTPARPATPMPFGRPHKKELA